ncbi:MAG TPA: hypothetical protein DCL21_04265 [Alphaproteobacteria bacterium]|nr:hypothetical protein [Alphaproteobacteria bacterium]
MKKIVLITTTFLISTSCVLHSTQDLAIEKRVIPEQFLKNDDVMSHSVEKFWKSPFENAELEKIVNLALKNNYSLQIALQHLQKSEATFKKTNSDRLPDLDLETSSQVTRSKIADSLDTRDSSNSMGLALSWELDLWGRLKHLSASENLEFKATEQDVQATYLLVVSSVIENYLDLSTAQQEQKLLSQIEDSRKDEYTVNHELYKTGGVELSALNIAKSNYKKAQYERSQSNKNVSNLKSSLAIILGINADQLEEAGLVKYKSSVKIGNVDLMKTRPDLIAAEQRVLASIEKTKAVKLERLPSLNVNLGYGFAASSVSDMYKNTVFNSLIGLNLPIFRAGEITQNINIAKSDQEIRTLEFLELSNKVVNEVSASYKNLESEKESLKFAQEKLQVAKDTLDIDMQLYNAGRIKYLAFLESKLKLLEEQNLYNSANNLYLQSILNVYRSIGGMAFQHNKKGISNES